MSTKRIINIIKEKCQQAPERAPDYHEVLLDVVTDIVWAEHQHAIRATTIQKLVTDQCEVLGDFIQRNNPEQKS
jgi:fructose-1,6-bisphosphatase